MIRVRHGQPVAETLQLSGDQQPGADRKAPGLVLGEEDELGEAGAVRHHHPPGLARIRRLLVPHHLDREGRDLPGPRRPDGGAVAAVDVALRQVEQQVDDAAARRHLADAFRHRRPHAVQIGHWGEERGEWVGLHGLTVKRAASI